MDDNTACKTSVAPQIKRFAWAAALLVLAFLLPLWRLVGFARPDELYSYIVLIPVVSGYLFWVQKKCLPLDSPPARLAALLFFIGGLLMLAWHWRAPSVAVADGLAQTTLAFLLLLAGMGCWILGGRTMRAMVFPFAVLIFMIPLPEFLRDALETGLQHGSAVAAGWMFAVSGLPVFQTGLEFRLPGISLRVAPECSGIHSTMVLFITSLLAGRLFLRSPWKRAVLCLVVIPLALLRNGFRIFVLGELCAHIGPEMIDSPVHHHGGPLFFALSLLPFFALLYYLRRSERLLGTAPKNTGK